MERLLNMPGLYESGDWDGMKVRHHVEQALKAHVFFHRDKDYLVQDGQVVIVDEFTGRIMPGRRWSDGLHQAIEAKEGVKIERENQTLATITFQNYFRMYKKLAGMTGTAETEARRILQDLQAGSHRDSDEPTDDPEGVPGHRLPHGRGEVPQRGQVHQGAERKGPAGAGRHDLGRKVRSALEDSQQNGRPARGAERQESRARSVDRRPGRPQRRRHRIDQHGRPRHRHSARRQLRSSSRSDKARRAGSRSGHDAARGMAAVCSPRSRRRRTASTTKSSTPAACTSSAPSGTNRGASTTSCAAARAVRATRRSRFFLSLQDDLLRFSAASAFRT